MSKLYMMNRMTYGAAAGGGILGKAAKWLGGLFKGKTKQVLTQTVLPTVKKALPYMVAPAAFAGAEALLEGGGGGGGGRGASGGWGGRRRRGITATELRGYRKVANLIHKEGMVSKRARGRKVC
jgi:hypothetical protein